MDEVVRLVRIRIAGRINLRFAGHAIHTKQERAAMTSYRRSYKPRIRRIIIIAGAVAVVAACAAGGVSAHAGTSPQLVYVCQQAPCANAQEFEVSDANGAPIFAVGEYGGAAVFGDNLHVFPPGTVYHPAVTQSWESPAAYERAFGLPRGCVAPSVWLEPRGIWVCRAGWWVLRLRL